MTKFSLVFEAKKARQHVYIPPFRAIRRLFPNDSDSRAVTNLSAGLLPTSNVVLPA
jgi:hypothetical protein